MSIKWKMFDLVIVAYSVKTAIYSARVDEQKAYGYIKWGYLIGLPLKGLLTDLLLTSMYVIDYCNYGAIKHVTERLC